MNDFTIDLYAVAHTHRIHASLRTLQRWAAHDQWTPAGTDPTGRRLYWYGQVEASAARRGKLNGATIIKGEEGAR